jgi:hypothetical protein
MSAADTLQLAPGRALPRLEELRPLRLVCGVGPVAA